MNAYQMPTEMSDFWTAPGDEVPGVNPDDLRNVLRLFRDVQAHTPAGQPLFRQLSEFRFLHLARVDSHVLYIPQHL
jgi:hypothetical protein